MDPKPSLTTRIRTDLTLKDYLETAAEASRRARFITIVMVVISVLLGVSVLNSGDFGWITLRLNALRDPESSYTIRRFPLLCVCDRQVQMRQGELCAEIVSKNQVLFSRFDQLKVEIRRLTANDETT